METEQYPDNNVANEEVDDGRVKVCIRRQRESECGQGETESGQR